MTLLSWLVVFLFALKDNGNIFCGILALIGISFAHLATNLLDDYFDYKKLSSLDCGFSGAPDSKCAYIRCGEADLKELLIAISSYLLVALFCGGCLTYIRGIYVPILAFVGGLIVLSYAKLSNCGLSELAVGIAFGPLLFEGVYFVMCGKFSFEIFLLSIAVVVFTVILLYVHTLLDFDGDISSCKKTLCCRIGDKFKALVGLGALLFVGYFFVICLVFFSHNYWYFLSFLTIPYAIQLYYAIYSYNIDKASVPKIYWYNFPIENVDTQAFHYRLFLARNLMVYFSILISVAIVLNS